MIDSAVRSFVRRMGWLVALQLSCLSGPGESSTRLPRLQSADRARIARSDRRRRRPPRCPGRPADPVAERAPARSPSAGRRPSSQALVGQRVEAIRRRGKFLIIDLDRDAVVVNPMLTGRFQLAAPRRQAARPRPRSSLGVRAARSRAPGRCRRLDARRGVAAGRRCRRRGPLSRPDPDGQGLPPAGRRRPAACPGSGETRSGPDADDPALTLDVWRDRIRRHPGELKNLLRNQAFVAGHRQRLQRRDPARGAAAAVPEARRRLARARRWTPSTRRRARRWPTPSTSCASASRRPSRRRCATSSRSTTRAASRVRAAARGSPRSRPGASSPRTAGAASTDGGRATSETVPSDRRCRRASSGQLEDLADMQLRWVRDAVEVDEHLDRRPELGGDATQRVAAS